MSFRKQGPRSYSYQVVVQFHSCVQTLRPRGLHHARLPCPSLSPGVWSNSCLLNQWCHPTISSSVVPFSSCFQSLPAPRSLPVSQLFASGGQRIGASAIFRVDFLWLTGLIFLLSKGLARVFQHHSLKALILQRSAFFMVQLSHLYMTTGKTIAFDYTDFCQQVMSLLFNMLSRFAIVFRSERIPVPWTWVLFHINCKDCFPSTWVLFTDIWEGLLSCFPVDLSPQRSFSASSSILG